MKNLIKSTLLLASVFLLSQCEQKAEMSTETPAPTNKIATDHVKVWNLAIQQVMDLTDAMPEEMYSYKPHDSVRTFAEQIVHIGNSSKAICNMYLKGAPFAPDQPEKAVAEMSKDEIKTFVKAQMMAVADTMATMTDQDLQAEIKSFGGNSMSKLEGLLTVHDHMTNHKAKANLYVRISGNTPPNYTYY